MHSDCHYNSETNAHSQTLKHLQQTMSLNLSFAITLIILAASAFAGRGGQIEDITAAQSTAIRQFVDAVQSGDATSAARWGGVAQQALVLERVAVSNLAVRASAPQAITAVAFDKATALAAKAGVSGSTLKHARTQWEGQETLQGAEAMVAKINDETVYALASAANAGGFRRAVPQLLGGTTAFANWMTPRSAVRP